MSASPACGAEIAGSSGAGATGGSSGAGGSSGGTTASGGTSSGSAGTNTSGTAGVSGTSTGGTSAGGTGPSVPVNCSGIESAGFELCQASADECRAVFTNGAGCTAVCAAAGLTCAQANEDVEDACAADTSRPATACDSGHQSDYCVCRRSGGGGGTSGAGGTSGTTGGTSGTAGSSTGGSATGGTSTGGSATGGASTGGTAGTAGTPSIGPRGCGCTTSAGEFGEVSDTISVDSGEVYDGGCKTFRADPDELGDGSQAEGQLPLFEVNGGTLRNVIINASGADGIHASGNARLENVHWLDVGEDALTVEGGTITIDCGSANNATDKIFQVNGQSTFRISNFTAKNGGKFIRQNGGTTFRTDIFIDHSDISDMGEAIFRTDSSTSHVTFTNSRYSDIGESLFIFGSDGVDGNSDQSSVTNIDEY